MNFGPVASLVIALSTSPAPRSIDAVKLTVPPTIDGKLDDAIWATLPKATEFEDPYAGGLAEDQTEAWVGYDERGLYAAFHCHFKNIADIVGREVRPGTAFEGDDFVALRIDPFNTKAFENMSRFQVNCLGTRNEIIAGGRATKAEWRGDWKAASSRVSDGYTIEMFIPWSAVNYPSSTTRDMTINFVRWHGKQNRKSIWSNCTAAERPELNGILKGVQTPARPRPKAQFLAYGLAEADKDGNKISLDGGLDVRFPVTTQMTAVGSINPDFKNVEQTVAGIDFTRSERFLGDSRPFFAEGANQFELTVPYAMGRMFYSRRIADFDFGAKAYGNLSPTDTIGALITRGEDRTVGVFNYVKRFGDKGGLSAFGTMDDMPGISDKTFGISGNNKMGNWGTSAEGVTNQGANGRTSAYTGEVFYNIPRLFATLRYIALSPGFAPSLALIPFNDYRGTSLYAEYNDEVAKGPISSVHSEFYVDRFDHYDGSTYSHGANLDLSLADRHDNAVRFGGEDRVFDGQRDRVLSAGYTKGRTNRFRRYTADIQVGERQEMSYRYARLGATQRVLGRLDLGLSFARLDFGGKTDQTIGTIGYELNAKQAITGRMVRSGNKTNAYVAFRSSGFTGQEWFVILGDPNAKKFKPRLTVKVVMPFVG